MNRIKWRVIALIRKASGCYPGITWSNLCHHLLPKFLWSSSPVSGLCERVLEADDLETFQTRWGPFCLPKPGQEVMDPHLQAIFIDAEYERDGIEVKEGDVVVDCGAHVGMFARFALQRGASRVICIEMDDANVQCLRQNLAAQAQRVTIFHTALWSREAVLQFYPDRCSDGHRVSEDGTSLVTKKAASLDTLLAQAGIDGVDFIKVDVEGAEPEVLAGALETIRRCRPKLALAVYHHPDEEKRIRDLFRKSSIHYIFLYRMLRRSDPIIVYGRASA